MNSDAKIRRQAFWGRSHRTGLRLLGDDLVLDFVVCGLGNNLPVDQVELGAIRTSSDNFLRVGVTNAGQGLELVRGGGV